MRSAALTQRRWVRGVRCFVLTGFHNGLALETAKTNPEPLGRPDHLRLVPLKNAKAGATPGSHRLELSNYQTPGGGWARCDLGRRHRSRRGSAQLGVSSGIESRGNLGWMASAPLW